MAAPQALGMVPDRIRERRPHSRRRTTQASRVLPRKRREGPHHHLEQPAASGNRREVVKKRGDGARACFENEGIGYEIVEMGGRWCVRIKPFYMFTGRNARTPLPSFVRTARATSRMRFDRNKNVEADLVFWSSFLGRGSETINAGNRHVEDLLIDASFLTVEVPEIGLISVDDEHQDQMPA